MTPVTNPLDCHCVWELQIISQADRIQFLQAQLEAVRAGDVEGPLPSARQATIMKPVVLTPRS
jgi:hypothetical protein